LKLKESLKRLRVGYFRELEFLREKLIQAQIEVENLKSGSQDSAFAQRERFIQETEVYFYDVREGLLDPELREVLGKAVKILERNLLIQVFSMTKKLEEAGIKQVELERVLSSQGQAEDAHSAATSLHSIVGSIVVESGFQPEEVLRSLCGFVVPKLSEVERFRETMKSEDERLEATARSLGGDNFRDVKKEEVKQVVEDSTQTIIKSFEEVGCATNEKATVHEKGVQKEQHLSVISFVVEISDENNKALKGRNSLRGTHHTSFIVSNQTESVASSETEEMEEVKKVSSKASQTSDNLSGGRDEFTQTEDCNPYSIKNDREELLPDLDIIDESSNESVEIYLKSFKKSFTLNLLHDPLKVLRRILLEQKKNTNNPVSPRLNLPATTIPLDASQLKREVLRLKVQIADLEGRLSVEAKRLLRALAYIDEIKHERDDVCQRAAQSIRKARSVREEIRTIRIQLTHRDRKINSLSRALLTARQTALVSPRSRSPPRSPSPESASSIADTNAFTHRTNVSKNFHADESADNGVCHIKAKTMVRNFSFEPIVDSLQSTERGSSHPDDSPQLPLLRHIYSDGLVKHYPLDLHKSVCRNGSVRI
jgi:hypothetical protein